MELKFFDFCSGIGGGRLGLQNNSFKCVGFSEIDEEAIKTYSSLFDNANEKNYGDLTKIPPKTLPDFDVLISGFPCQTFSIVGKREGLGDKDKGQIIFYITKILRKKQPKFFILENVKGLINHNKGNTLKTIISLLESSNFRVFYKVLNTLDFGLPHSRERIYFVGIRKDIDKEFNFPIPEKNNLQIKDFLFPNEKNIFLESSRSYETFLKYLNNSYNRGKYSLDSLFEKDYLILDTRQSDLRLYHNKVPTLRRNRQGILYVWGKKLYRLSALEALYLQGFGEIPKLNQKITSLKDSDILRQCGNAMSVNVIDKIAKQLIGNHCG